MNGNLKLTYKLFLVFCGGLFFTSISFAATLQMSGKHLRDISSQGVTVPVHSEAILTQQGKPVSLYLTGAGIYKKPIVIMNVPVYVALSYTNLPGGITGTDPMAAIRQASTKVIQLIALQTLTTSDIRFAIESALEANSVNLEDPYVQEALSKVVFSAGVGDSALLVGKNEANGTQSLELTVREEVTGTAGPDLANTYWQMWFGIPMDKGINALKRELISGQ